MKTGPLDFRPSIHLTARGWLGVLACACLFGAAACADRSVPETSIRLIDRFADAEVVGGEALADREPQAKTLWDFSDPAFASPVEIGPEPPEGEEPTPLEIDHPAGLGWSAGYAIETLRVEDGTLRGTTTKEWAAVDLHQTKNLDRDDIVHGVQVRMKVSAGTDLAFDIAADERVPFERFAETYDRSLASFHSPLQTDGEFHTYTFDANHSGFAGSIPASDARHVVLLPSDAVGATFEIEWVRLIFRKEHLAQVPSGVGWHGLSDVFRETIVARAPETVRYDLDVPGDAWLDLAVGTLEPAPVRFDVTIHEIGGAQGAGGDDAPLRAIRRTVTRPDAWEELSVDLADLAGRSVRLELGLHAEDAGSIGFWGSPALRTRSVETADGIVRLDRERSDGPGSGLGSGPPQGVLFILADTLRRDHLEVYGYGRETAPNLTRLASNGVLVRDAIAQGAWTKVSVPSMMTSLYPTTLDLVDFNDRIPGAATTLAEVFRAAGYATWASSSVPFTGRLTNMHQGYEVLHERTSLDLPRETRSKTARAFVDRLLPWLESHRDTPFFAFLHVMDPHDPYAPYAPWDTRWASADDPKAHEERVEAVREHIEDPMMKPRGLPRIEELEKAGVDPEEFVRVEKDWYDGSTRAMDAEIARVLERLEELGLAERTLVVVVSDHGEEFLDHGAHFHEHDVYGEMVNVPMMMRWPGRLPAGTVVEETVQNLDLVPTLLDIAGLPIPEGIQGHSFAPLITDDASWRARPAISEWTRRTDQRKHGGVDMRSIIQDGWKLVHNVERPEGHPEFELYRHDEDPLDQNDVAADHPDIIEQLAEQLAAWHRTALEARMSDEDALSDVSAEELEQLRSLGYVQ